MYRLCSAAEVFPAQIVPITFLPSMPKYFAAANRWASFEYTDAELRFGCRGKVDGIGCPQKHRGWQLLIDVPDSQENLAILRKPPESSRLDMCPHLAH